MRSRSLLIVLGVLLGIAAGVVLAMDQIRATSNATPFVQAGILLVYTLGCAGLGGGATSNLLRGEDTATS